MHSNAYALFLPALFVISGVLAQQSASPTSATPAVTFPANNAFVFCSAPDCSGTCEVATNVPKDTGHVAPNNMPFQSFYWYDYYGSVYYIYTCISYYNCGYVEIDKPNTCFNMLDNGVPTDFGWYWYEFVDQYRN